MPVPEEWNLTERMISRKCQINRRQSLIFRPTTICQVSLPIFKLMNLPLRLWLDLPLSVLLAHKIVSPTASTKLPVTCYLACIFQIIISAIPK